jgi:hypothetical protein
MQSSHTTSTHNARRPWGLPRWCGAAVLTVTVALAGADGLGLFRRLPRPQALLARLDKAVAGLGTYEATMMIFGGAGTPGETCRQFKNDQGEVVTHVRTMLGYQYVERWQGDVWEYYHHGLGLQGRVEVRNSARLRYPHWLVSGYPSVPEVAAAVRAAEGHVVEGSGSDPNGEVWVLRCRPTVLSPTEAPPAEAPGLLSAEWRVMLLQDSDLPTRIMPASMENSAMSGISLSSIRSASPPAGADWRRLVGVPAVKRRHSFTCNAAEPESVRRVTQAIRGEFAAYQRHRYPQATSRTP